MHIRFRSVGAVALVLSQSFAVLPAFAASFPDVPFTHIYREQIETLADRAIVKGNPDGTFKPGKTVNRAEILTMLYRATGKSTTAPSKACFKDVPVDAWFAGVVCDVAAKGYVGGYDDKTFKPEKEVNRVESLKMIQTVFGFKLKSDASTEPLKEYNDVALDAWYSTYIANAYVSKVLPIAGLNSSQFKPDSALLRSEAAAFIFNALGLKLTAMTTSSSSSAAGRSSSTRTESTSNMQTFPVDFPFGDDGVTSKDGNAYTFTLKNPVVTSIDVSVEGDLVAVQCRLYKLDAGTDFALEYYIGHIVDNHCSMRVSLGNGDYQLEIVPKGNKSLPFSVQALLVEGDDNDGFREASSLVKGKPKTVYLEEDDYAEWYYFKLTQQTQLTVDISGNGNERCLIYPMSDVDLYGFSGPLCDETYDFPPGTYYVGVMRRDEKAGKESFTILLK